MALNKDTLKSELIGIFTGTQPTHIITAQKTANAIANYWALGQHPLNGIVISTSSVPLLFSGLINAWGPKIGTPITAAKYTADTLEVGLLAVIITGSPYGIGGVASVQKSAAISPLIDAYANASNQNVNDFCQKFATAIDTFTKTNQVYGTGTPPNVPPPTGSFA